MNINYTFLDSSCTHIDMLNNRYCITCHGLIKLKCNYPKHASSQLNPPLDGLSEAKFSMYNTSGLIEHQTWHHLVTSSLTAGRQ